jgi:hypothetical protein
MDIGRVPYIPLYLFLRELLIWRCLVYKEKGEGEKQALRHRSASLRMTSEDGARRIQGASATGVILADQC